MEDQNKFSQLKRLTALFILILMFFSIQGCDKGTEPEEQEPQSKLSRSDVETVTEFFAVKQSVTYDMLKIFSGNYTHKFFEGGDLTYEEIDEIFAGFAELAQYKKSVTEAANNLLSKSSLNKPGNIKAVEGLGDALHGFFSWITGSGKRSRERLLKVASNLSDADRKALYNSLRPEWKSKTSSESDFWQKVQSGEFDNQASQMYNDFYHNADTDFPFVAQDKNLTIQKIVVKEGAEGIEKGSKLMIETVKAATPLGKGMDMVEKADEYVQKTKNLYNDPVNTIKDEVKSAVANKLGEFVDIDGAVDAGKLSEGTGTAIKFISDYAFGSDDPGELIKKAMDMGLGKLLDSDNKGSKADIAIAEKKNDDGNGPSVVISVDPKDDDADLEDVIDILVDEGDWIFTTFDDEGNSDKVEIYIDSGIGTVIVVSTDPEGEHNKGEYALSVWASPADPGPNEGVTVYARVNPRVAGVDIYFSITGTDGYSNESTVATDEEGLATFYIPGGAEGVHDNVTIRIVSTGLTRTISYTF